MGTKRKLNIKMRLLNKIKFHWHEYLCTKTTIIALVLIYFEIFHFNAINSFWASLGANIIITTAIANVIVGFLIRSKK